MWCMWCFCKSNDIAIVKYAGHKSKHKSELFQPDSGTATKNPREDAVQTKAGSFISTYKRKENKRMVTTSSVSVGGVREKQRVSQCGNNMLTWQPRCSTFPGDGLTSAGKTEQTNQQS